MSRWTRELRPIHRFQPTRRQKQRRAAEPGAVRLRRGSYDDYPVGHLRSPLRCRKFVRADVEGHTSPDKWAKPRVFHTPFDPKYETRITKSSIDFQDMAGKILSPNEAYWFSTEPPDTTKEGPWSTSVFLYNERPYLIKIEFKNHASYGVKAKWINEKLVYFDVWWGRVLGSSLVYDVEKEDFIIKEMQNDGVIPFQQWEQMKKPQANNSFNPTPPRALVGARPLRGAG